MKVLNLIFNRMGNSFSAMLDYHQFQLQITDGVMFSVEDTSVEVSGVSVDTDFPLKVYLKIEDEKVGIFFNSEKMHVENLWEFFPSEGGFFSDSSEVLFLAGMDKKFSSYLKDGKLFIPEENFFKSIAAFIIKNKQGRSGK